MVCEDRDDLHLENIGTTENLILSHLKWGIFAIAKEHEIHAEVINALQEASVAGQRYSRYLPQLSYDSEDG